MEENITRFTMRLPGNLYADVMDEAKANRRSLHAEILVLLQEALEQREEKKIERHKK